jgi:hypothetical protein
VRTAAAVGGADEDTCTQTSDGGVFYVLYVRQINVGRAVVRLYGRNGTLKKSWTVNVPPAGDRPGGRILLRTQFPYCGGAVDSYFTVYDSVSTRWSTPRHVSTGCSRL